jgi:hypothetical protein
MPSHMRALPKPKPGSSRAMQRARARLAKTRERAAKDALLVPPIHPAYLLERYDVPVRPLVKPIRGVPIK